MSLIADVLTHYGADLTRVSEFGWRSIRCPFTELHTHGDRTASARVNLEKGAFICHGCGIKGDAIGLIMQRENLDYIAACEWAQSVFGAGVSDVPRATEKPKRRPSRWRTKLLF